MIKPRKRPRRKSPHQELVNEAGDWLREIVVQRQGGVCLAVQHPPLGVRMSCGGGMQGAHILRKGGQYSSIRFHEDNVVGMCRNHHIFWAHQNEYDFYQWVESIFPGRIERLKQIALESSGKIDFKALICVLKAEYRKNDLPPGTSTLRESSVQDNEIPF